VKQKRTSLRNRDRPRRLDWKRRFSEHSARNLLKLRRLSTRSYRIRRGIIGVSSIQGQGGKADGRTLRKRLSGKTLRLSLRRGLQAAPSSNMIIG
jgi:hypothetical protein